VSAASLGDVCYFFWGVLCFLGWAGVSVSDRDNGGFGA